jgi:hypothetical protein
VSETIEQVAVRLGVPVRSVQAMITPLCREHGPQKVVAVALGMRDTELTQFAVEKIVQLSAALVVTS